MAAVTSFGGPRYPASFARSPRPLHVPQQFLADQQPKDHDTNAHNSVAQPCLRTIPTGRPSWRPSRRPSTSTSPAAASWRMSSMPSWPRCVSTTIAAVARCVVSQCRLIIESWSCTWSDPSGQCFPLSLALLPRLVDRSLTCIETPRYCRYL